MTIFKAKPENNDNDPDFYDQLFASNIDQRVNKVDKKIDLEKSAKVSKASLRHVYNQRILEDSINLVILRKAIPQLKRGWTYKFLSLQKIRI